MNDASMEPVEIPVHVEGQEVPVTKLRHWWGRSEEALKGLLPDDPEIVPVFGLPRTCSELLVEFLSQHPQIACTPTSGLPAWLVGESVRWRQVPGWSHERPSVYPRVKRQTSAALREHHGFLRFRGIKVVLEKHRGWASLFPMLSDLLGRSIKGICTLRDPRNVFASFEKLWEQRGFDVPARDATRGDWWVHETEFARAMSLLNATDGMIGSCVTRLQGFIGTPHADGSVIVEGSRFVDDPIRTANRIVKHLGLDDFDGWEPDRVEATVCQDDIGWGWGEHLHEIREKIEPLDNRSWRRVGKQVLDAIEGSKEKPSIYPQVYDWMKEAI